jgi:quercetin dioxygenase-like cupin family protein
MGRSFLDPVTGSWKRIRKQLSRSSRSSSPNETLHHHRFAGTILRGSLCRAPIVTAGSPYAERSRLNAGARFGRGYFRSSGIRTTVVAGDPTQAGPYTIRLSIPANTKIQAHTHRDNRTAIVISGVWYFGYGPIAGEAEEKALPAGSFYTEPGGVAHFAETKADPVIVYITGYGPSDTVYVK